MNVVFIIHARPEVTRKVFEQIRIARPDRLFIVADGPRDTAQLAKCAETRAVTEKTDWTCEVFRNYSEVNLGCRERVISGLDWVFQQVTEGIILEDDCLPDPSFFPFCTELLLKYSSEDRVGYISGQNFVGVPRGMKDSYWFSKYGGIWGWATWRRAWKLFDREMLNWPADISVWTKKYFERPWVRSFWDRIYSAAFSNQINAWSYNWSYSLQKRGAWAVVPSKNLVLNIGFGADAAHTIQCPSCYHKAQLQNVTFPLKHPNVMTACGSFDRFYENKIVRPAVVRYNLDRYTNKYFYGSLLRKLPVLGSIWAVLRRKAERK